MPRTIVARPASSPARRLTAGAAVVAGAAACLAISPAARGDGPLLPTAPVALSGQSVPGTGDTTTGYVRFGSVAINPAGQVLFGATLSGPNVTPSNDSAVFIGRPPPGGVIVDDHDGGPVLDGGIQPLAREGQAAHGGDPAVVYGDLLDTGAINPEGQGVFTAEVRFPGVATRRYDTVAGSPGDLRLVHRHGADEGFHGQPVLNSGPRAVLWPSAGGHVLYWDGATAAPVTTPGTPLQPTINRAGRIACTFFGSGDDPPAGLYAGPPGDFRPVAARGGAAPGLPAGHTFDLVLDASQNNAGQFAFLASARSAAPDSYAWGLWAGRPNDLRLLARDRDPAPGMPAGYRFERILFDIDSPTTPALSATGHVAFWGSFEDATGSDQGTGAWLARAGEPMRLLARRGDAVPGAGAAGDAVLDFFYDNGLGVNAAGQVVMLATSVTATDAVPRDTLVAVGDDGVLSLLARTGSPFEVSPGDVRVVSDVFVRVGSTGEDGRASPFNDAGQFVYRLGFTDGTSGLFITVVPEPAAGGFAAAVVAMMLGGRPCRRRT